MMFDSKANTADTVPAGGLAAENAEPVPTRQGAMDAFLAIRAGAQKDFPDGMSLEEINDIIAE